MDITGACADSIAGPMDSENGGRFIRVYRRVFRVLELMAMQTLSARDVCAREAVARCFRKRPARTCPVTPLKEMVISVEHP